MNYILFDDDNWHKLLPLTFTRPVSKIRIGILTIEEKWNNYFNSSYSYLTESYLNKKYLLKISDDNIFINSSAIPSIPLVQMINNLKINDLIIMKGKIIAFRVDYKNGVDISNNLKSINLQNFNLTEVSGIDCIENIWEIYQKANKEISNDFQILTARKISQVLSKTNTLIGSEDDLFLEEGAKVEAAILNAKSGPIYIGKDAEIMEGAMIRGPFFLGDNGVVKMGAKIYGATSIGKYCKVGGEISNSVFFDYSNKAHDGFIGDSVIGEWCNLGADTNNSNLKNNYAPVKLWNYIKEEFENTENQFCGLFMGDHSKAGINTMFNTGTVVGVSANIFGAGFPRNFIPSFSWGGSHGFSTFSLSKSFETARIMMARRGLELEDVDKEILNHIFQFTHKFRHWEKQK